MIRTIALTVAAAAVIALAAWAGVLSAQAVSEPAPAHAATVQVAAYSPCSTDTECAEYDTWVAQDVYGIAVWANDIDRTPDVDEARHGQYVELSCDAGSELTDTDEGWACVSTLQSA